MLSRIKMGSTTDGWNQKNARNRSLREASVGRKGKFEQDLLLKLHYYAGSCKLLCFNNLFIASYSDNGKVFCALPINAHIPAVH